MLNGYLINGFIFFNFSVLFSLIFIINSKYRKYNFLWNYVLALCSSAICLGFFVSNYFIHIKLKLSSNFLGSNCPVLKIAKFTESNIHRTVNKYFHFGSLNIVLAMLTILISILLLLWIWDQTQIKNDLIISILVTEFALVNVFFADHILWFFICFELSALPLIYIIGNYGPTFRKIKALYYFISYTMFGSAFLLFGIVFLVFKTNSFFISDFLFFNFTFLESCICWICLFIGFSVKIPIMPFHLWLLEAHVEAPTVGSVILAALLLKVGGFGIIEFCCKIFYDVSRYFAPFIIIICFFSMLYATVNAFIQLDIKRSIAYSSIAHMNGSLIGLFCFNKIAWQGFIISMLSHGFTSAGLFFMAGILYKMYHTKNILYFGGLNQGMPLFSFFFVFFCFSNGAFPGTFNFLGELFLILGIMNKSFLVSLLFITVSSFLAIYFVWFAGRIIFGELNGNFFIELKDLTINQTVILSILVVLIVYFGLCANSLLLFLEI